MAVDDVHCSDPGDERYDLEPPDPVAYEPVQYEPVQYEPVQYEPVQYEPVQYEPAAYDPVTSDTRAHELKSSASPPPPADVRLPVGEPPRRRARVEPVPPDDLAFRPTVGKRPPPDPEPLETVGLGGMTRWSDVLLDPGRRSIGALALVGLAAACVAGLYLWRSRPEAVPVGPSGPAHVAVASPVSPSPREVVIDVSGKVRDPGVVRLPAGSRVADAIEAAGGPRHGVDTSQLNLARKVVDGEQILVGTAPTPAAGDGSAALVDINTATADQLEELPEVGPVLAGRIVEYRQEHGGFRSVDELNDVSGIGPKTFAELEDKVRV